MSIATDHGLTGDALRTPKISDSGRRIAFLSDRDDALERIWTERGHVGNRLKEKAFDLVVSPAYSTYWGRAPFDGLIEVARTAIVASLLTRTIPTIPSVVWRNEFDLGRFAEWLGESSASNISIHSSTMRSRADWEWHLQGVALLGQLFGEGAPRLLAYGPSTMDRIGDILDSWPGEVTFASQLPWRLATGGQRLGAGLERLPAPDLSIGQLISANASTFEAAVEIARGRRSVLAGI